MSKRDRLSAEERWEEAAHIATSATRIATSLTHMGTVETLVSTAAVCEKFPDFRTILQDAGYPGYPREESNT